MRALGILLILIGVFGIWCTNEDDINGRAAALILVLVGTLLMR